MNLLFCIRPATNGKMENPKKGSQRPGEITLRNLKEQRAKGQKPTHTRKIPRMCVCVMGDTSTEARTYINFRRGR